MSVARWDQVALVIVILYTLTDIKVSLEIQL